MRLFFSEDLLLSDSSIRTASIIVAPIDSIGQLKRWISMKKIRVADCTVRFCHNLLRLFKKESNRELGGREDESPTEKIKYSWGLVLFQRITSLPGPLQALLLELWLWQWVVGAGSLRERRW